MCSAKLEGGLEALDRSDAPLSDLVAHAAQVLDADLNRDPEQCRQAAAQQSVSAYSFKEQWVLRWLTRSIAQAVQPSKDGKGVGTNIYSLLNIAPWKLMQHLLAVIPKDIQIEILAERKFLASLDRVVRSYLDRPLTTSEAIQTHVNMDTYERSRKRRRTSPSQPEPAHGSQTLGVHLLRVCSSCASLMTSADVGQDQAPPTIWTSVDDGVSMLAASLELVLRLLKDSGNDKAATSNFIKPLLPFWARRPATTTESARQSEIKTFNKHCLPVCLELLEISKENHLSPTGAANAVFQDLETLLATTVIVPLRERFNKKHAKTWKTQHLCLTWKVVQPIYHDFMMSFGAERQDPDTKAKIMINFEWKARAHLLYDMASRLLPKDDLRKKQQEQDWLDCLLVVLAYTCCPRLPQVELSAGRDVAVVDVAYPSDVTDSTIALEKLAQWTTSSRCSPSLQAASYIIAALAPWQELSTPWSILVHLLTTHSNLLLSNAGMPTSNFALTEVISRVERSRTSQDEYELLKTGVLVPVLRAFSSARALKEFVLLWREQLQEALRVTGSRDKQDGDIAAVSVWQDEDLIDSFTEEIDLSTSTVLSEETLSESMKAMSELVTRIGTTLDIFAQITIVTAVLRARRRSRTPLNAQSVQVLADLAVTALAKRSDYQGQRWRLWSLLGAIQTASMGVKISDELLDREPTPPLGVSLAVLQSNPDISRSPQWYQECVERFRLIVYAAGPDSKVFEDAFKDSVDQIEAHLKHLVSAKDPQHSLFIWDGRSLNICGNQQLISACIGVLLTRPACLSTRTDFFECALQALLNLTSHEPSKQTLSSHSLQTILAASLYETGPKAGRGLKKSLAQRLTRDAPSDGLVWHLSPLMEYLLLQDRASGNLRSIGTTLFEQTQDVKFTDKQPAEVARHLATMDYLSDQQSTTFTKSDSSASWVAFGERLAKSGLWADFPSAFATYRCLRNIAIKIWSNTAEDESARVRIVSGMRADMEKSKPSKSKARLLKEPSRLFLTEAMLCDGTDTRTIDTATRREMTSMFFKLAVSDLGALTSTANDDQSLAKIAVLLETLSNVLGHDSASTELHTAVGNLYRVLTEEAESGETGLISLRRVVLRQCGAFKSSVEPNAPSEVIKHKLEANSLSIRPTAGTSQQWLARTASDAADFVRCLGLQERVTCMSLLSSPDESLQIGNLKPILIAAIALHSSKTDVETCAELQAGLADVARLKDIDDVKDLHTLLLELENANLILKVHPVVVGQAVVDKLMAQLALLLAGNNINHPQSGQLRPEAIHNRVCIIVGSLLSRFRRRIADRYHLLLPVLQQLVRCLFYSEAVVQRARQPTIIGSDPSSFLRSIPSWLTTSSQTLPPNSAVEVSRLLSSICNPTASAAKSSRTRGKGNELNDETKRVKAVAGQHMQYLVMDYCRCSLDGDIAPGTREKLLPGMYTILDAMSRDLMRAMNSAMDPSSRAIFKTLYDDWTRYGKWDKS